MSIELDAAVKRILVHGPDRVVINTEAEAVNSSYAHQHYGVLPDVIFIRNDGWSLGAPDWLETVAYELWTEEWTGFMRRGKKTALPITAYGEGR
ncbi:MAG TPA: hypothetical protein VF974_08105 [Patescibacteria group bacterium]